MSVNGTADVDLGDLPVDVLLGEHTVLDVLLSYFVQVLVAIFFFFCFYFYFDAELASFLLFARSRSGSTAPSSSSA